MAAHRILVVSNRRNIQRSATRALVSVGCEVQSVGFDSPAIADLAKNQDMYLIDTDSKSEEFKQTVDLISNQSTHSTILLVSNDLENDRVLQHMLGGGLNNMIGKHGGIATKGLVDETELVTTCSKLLTGNIFGLEKYLPNPDIHHIQEVVLKHSKDRSAALDELEDFLRRIDCYEGIVPLVLDVADELLMNAIFSAPTDESGTRKYDARDRRERFDLLPEEEVALRFACDGKNVLLSVADQFGSLEREILMRYLGMRFKGGKASVEYKPGGAGVGLFKVANSITQLIFNVDVGKRTEVIASFYIRSGVRAFKSSSQSFNLFMVNEER